MSDWQFGIGRVPADVDPVSEALAQLDAQEIMERLCREHSRRAPEHGVVWEGKNLNPYWYVPRDGEVSCAKCGLDFQGEFESTQATVRRYCTSYGPSLCVPCGDAVRTASDQTAIQYLIANREAWRQRAEYRYPSSGCVARGSRWRWSAGHSVLDICCKDKIEPPSWWGEWDYPDSPLASAVALILGPAPEAVTIREPESCRCRRCGTVGREGGYPFSTNPASGLCDDCH